MTSPAPDRELLLADLRRDEGVRHRPYRDSVGKTTIGIGRNLDDLGLGDDEILLLVHNDCDRVEAELDAALPWWRGLSEPRQRALANLCFNLGLPRLLQFQRMLAALEAGRFDRAAAEALDSRWAAQTGARAIRIATMIREG